eukprot:2272270-Amphidinium_carterae.1
MHERALDSKRAGKQMRKVEYSVGHSFQDIYLNHGLWRGGYAELTTKQVALTNKEKDRLNELLTSERE